MKAPGGAKGTGGGGINVDGSADGGGRGGLDDGGALVPFFGGGGKGGVRASGRGLDGGSAPLVRRGGVRARDLEEGGGGVRGLAATADGLAGGAFDLGFKLGEADLPLVSEAEVARLVSCGGLYRSKI